MGRLILVSKPGGQPPAENPYREMLRGDPIEKLVVMFNRGIGSNAWTTSRGHFLVALREAFLASGYDCSSFIDETGMSMNRDVMVEGRAVVLVPLPEEEEGADE